MEPTPTSPQAVHVAITRKVKAGCEQDFETHIHKFFKKAKRIPGTQGAFLLRPLDEGHPREYGILRSFDNDEARQAFYASDVFRRWEEECAPYMEGEATRRRLHGLEAFFPTNNDASAKPPATWKMAILTWIAVNPAVFLASQGVSRTLGKLPILVDLLLVNALVVTILTWLFMPALTRLADSWLTPH
ncbi:MAG: antibiotic biosynthesis monooxygenase [Deltaproteobacteria bacterium]|nr:MAG: antibiotic biosynthesis monooxygenase [Deltaproteobacteria bacterium]